MSTFRTALIAAGALLLVTGVTADTLRRGAAGEPNSLDPQVASGNASSILRDLNTGLTTLDAAGRLITGAAEAWDISPDGLTYRFHLRENLKWSDGSPIVADDFVYSMRRLLTPGTGTRHGPFFYSVKNARSTLSGDLDPAELGVRAEDERTIVFELEHPDGSLLQKLGSFAAAPVPREVIKEHGRGWSRPGRLLSSGPYRLVEWVPQSHLTLEKNPHFYAADSVRMQNVQYYPTTNAETAMRRYLAGEIDILFLFPPDRMKWIEENLPGQLKVWPALGISYILLNHRKPPFDDVRVRRALSISIDRRQIVNRIMVIGVPPAYSLTPPTVTGYDPPAPDYANQPMPGRLAEARALLESAGYDANRPLAFELRYEPLEEERRLAVALQATWREIGVKVELLHTDFGTLHRSVRTGDYTASRFFWYSPTDDPETFLGLVESDNPNNLSGYRNASVDRLIARAETLLDPDARRAAYREAEVSALEDYPVLPLFFTVHRRLVARDIHGFMPNTSGVTPSRYAWRE